LKTVLVTGASSGIGLATAIAAGRAGLLPIGTVRRPDGDLALREAAEKAGVCVDVVTLEVTDPDSVAACVRSVIALHGRLDAVVNNAGVAGLAPTVELSTMESLRAVMEVNFFGVVALTRAAMPHLRTTGGRLVTISSVRGVIGQPFHEGYSAAKFAVEGFMEALAPVAAQVGVTVSLVETGGGAGHGVTHRCDSGTGRPVRRRLPPLRGHRRPSGRGHPTRRRGGRRRRAGPHRRRAAVADPDQRLRPPVRGPQAGRPRRHRRHAFVDPIVDHQLRPASGSDAIGS
jgi:NAD(P)-dependent dehydrogenase (short-subunit alcohol dehydrogenase family)